MSTNHNQYFLPPRFEFKCKKNIDDVTRYKLCEIMSHVLCHKDVDFSQIKQVNVDQNQYLFGVIPGFKSDEINLIVPKNLSYNPDTKLWKSDFNNYLIRDNIPDMS